MPTIYGTVANGKIELTAPADWPDGTSVRVDVAALAPLPPGLPDDDDVSPVAIARRLELMDAEPIPMSDEEYAAWRAWLAERKAEQLAMWDKSNSDVDRLFQ